MKSDSSTVILIILFIGNVKELSTVHTKGLSFAGHLLPVHSYKSFVRKRNSFSAMTLHIVQRRFRFFLEENQLNKNPSSYEVPHRVDGDLLHKFMVVQYFPHYSSVFLITSQGSS